MRLGHADDEAFTDFLLSEAGARWSPARFARPAVGSRSHQPRAARQGASAMIARCAPATGGTGFRAVEAAASTRQPYPVEPLGFDARTCFPNAFAAQPPALS
jgi:hypothetical protein